MSAALAWGGVLLAGALWGGGALVAQFLIDGGIAPQSLSLARFALGVPLLWWLHWRVQRTARSADARWRDLSRQRAVPGGRHRRRDGTERELLVRRHRTPGRGTADGDLDLLRAGDRGAGVGRARLRALRPAPGSPDWRWRSRAWRCS
jgi:hypothetical protein